MEALPLDLAGRKMKALLDLVFQRQSAEAFSTYQDQNVI